ncbi:hypothetical protein ACS0TY_007167 [Phlomoides rotata]
MGYIYEAMDRAKEAIAKVFYKEEDYKEAFEIIDRRWDCQLHKPLHAAGFFLNPQFFYNLAGGEVDREVSTGFYEAVMKLIPDVGEQEKVYTQLSTYRHGDGMFGTPVAVRLIDSQPPTIWWENFGSDTPDLRSFAIKVLSLTCSSSGCERNWSIFENVHAKRRNRLDQQRMNDLVYVKYNRALKRRYEARGRLDPISLTNIDESNEWVTGRMEEDEEDELVFEGDDLTWGVVARASGVDEPAYDTRGKGKGKEPETSSRKQVEKGKGSKSKGKGKGKSVGGNTSKLIDEEEEEEEEEFNENDPQFSEEEDDDDFED